ncbi:Uncharacterised protein [Avibacterium paragallinarum]|uniref:Uncharacterized protein n=1 Tax=Avibacterium paragallinarum TaxID=728 RepID=A0A377I9J2_AVIPA|nr:Uncharacterised protein [Avibacterium paragallinarum]
MFILGMIAGAAVAFAVQAFFHQYKLVDRNKDK